MKTFTAAALLTLLAACGGSQQQPETSTSGGEGTIGAGDTSSEATTGGGTDASGAGGAPATTGGGEGATTGGGATGPETSGGGAQTQAQMVAAGNVDNGKKLYDANACGGCHGSKDKPPKKFPNVFKSSWDDKEIEEAFTVIKKGKAPMPAFGDKLDDKAIADLVAFMKANSSK